MTQRTRDLPGPDHRSPEEFWEGHYRRQRDDAKLWGTRINPVLAEVAGRLDAGTALDLACGAGGDTLWLARHGWRVTAVDISATAVEQVGRLAEANGLGAVITAERHDLAESFPAGAYDLVSAQYFHTPYTLDRAVILRAAAAAVRPGGRLLVVDHGSIAPWSWNQDPAPRFPTPAEIQAELALPAGQWTTERADRPTRVATGPGGQTATVTDHVLLIRRTAADRR